MIDKLLAESGSKFLEPILLRYIALVPLFQPLKMFIVIMCALNMNIQEISEIFKYTTSNSQDQ